MNIKIIVSALAGLTIAACQSTSTTPTRDFSLQKVVAADHKLLVSHFHILNPDCSAQGEISVRIVVEPANGHLEIVPGSGFSTLPKSDPAAHCNDAPSQGVNVTYVPNRAYIGADAASVSAIFPNGRENIVRYAITVK